MNKIITQDEYDALIKDKERLDWLETQGQIGINHERWGEYYEYAGGKGFKSLREVCDKYALTNSPK